MRALAYGAIVLLSTAFNFIVFLLSYKALSFPSIHEEQRVENAPYVFIYVLPSFFLVSLVVVALCFFLSKKK